MFKRLTTNSIERGGKGLAWLAFALAILVGALGVNSTPVVAVQPNEILKDAGLEKRARNLSAELRCLVCQNQSIDDSDAPLAQDLRRLVRERLTAGDTDQQVITFIVARYGEFVLLRPPLGTHTIILWFAPILVLLAGIWLARRSLVTRPAESETPSANQPLSTNEQKRLEALLDADSQINDIGGKPGN